MQPTRNRFLWGEITEDRNARKKVKRKLIVLPQKKVNIYKQIKPESSTKHQEITIDNPLVTQTVEVMNQTEMIQSLIDAYTTNNAYNNYVLNSCQEMPTLDLPADTTINLIRSEKFLKPIWYIPPKQTKFTRGIPENYPKITKPIVIEALRKSLAGLLRLKGFNECNDSALVMFVDSVDEFYKSLMDSINLIIISQRKDRRKQLDIDTLEKGYHSLTKSSLTCLHNYYKNEIVSRNQAEIKEFQGILQEYDKLKQESQNLQKLEVKEEDYMGMLDYITPPTHHNNNVVHHDQHSAVSIMNFFETATNGFDGSIIETTGGEETMTLSVGPSSIESEFAQY